MWNAVKWTVPRHASTSHGKVRNRENGPKVMVTRYRLAGSKSTGRVFVAAATHCKTIPQRIMLASIAGRTMFPAVMDWLRIEANLNIVQAAGAGMAALIGAAVWVWERLERRKEEKRERAEKRANEARRVPARDLPHNKKQVPLPSQRPVARSAWPQYIAMVVVALGAGALTASVISYYNNTSSPAVSSPPAPPPTVVVSVKVCRGEHNRLCPPHDVWVGCNNPDDWAKSACITFSAQQLSVAGGNRCGYTVINYLCTKKAP